MSEESIKYIDHILDSLYQRGICKQCGNYQSHSLRRCGICGDWFFKQDLMTLLDAIIIARVRNFTHIPLQSCFKPEYLAEVHRQGLELRKITIKEFINRVEERIQEREVK